MTAPSKLDPEKQREYNRRYRERHPERVKAKQREREEYRRKWMKDHPEAAWSYRLKKFHHLTIEGYEAIWRNQSGCCYLCNESLVRGKTHIDHDHACCPEGQSCHLCRRGLACRRCNWIIGWCDEDAERLHRIADNFSAVSCFTMVTTSLGRQQCALLWLAWWSACSCTGASSTSRVSATPARARPDRGPVLVAGPGHRGCGGGR